MKRGYVKIRNHPELVKDTNSGAILNVDKAALDQYRINRGKKILEEKRINRLEEDISTMKSMLAEILKEIKR